MKLLLATQNDHKIIEFKNKLNKYNIELISLKDLNDNSDVVENGKTFEENAIIKAKYYYEIYHIVTISDDSGLVVNSLNGAPGVYSKRYFGGDDNDNINLLLKNLENKKDRSAYFESVICLYDGTPHIFDGKCYGTIGYQKIGNNGFGYDPIFMCDDKNSFASITLEEKNKISHRANALNKFIDFIKNY